MLSQTPRAKLKMGENGSWDGASVTCSAQELVKLANPFAWTEIDEDTGDPLFETELFPGRAYRLHRITQEKVVVTFEGDVEE